MILAAVPPQLAVSAPAFTCDAALTALFTPPRPLVGRYEVCTTAQPLEAIQSIGGGPIEALEALDAFGTAGSYKRSALSRLYGGTRARVSRGWLRSPGRFESYTRITPYPDVSLTHLIPGTLEIRYTIESRHTIGQ
jgi:hypothetical protein